MATLNELLTTVNDPDQHQERDCMFQYLQSQDVFGTDLTQGQARIEFEQAMNGNCGAYYTPQDLAQVYLSQYNRRQTQQTQAQTQQANSVSRASSKAKTLAVAGLGASLIATGIMDESTIKSFMQAGGLVVTGAAGVGYLLKKF
jgi:hypothetical protein